MKNKHLKYHPDVKRLEFLMDEIDNLIKSGKKFPDNLFQPDKVADNSIFETKLEDGAIMSILNQIHEE